MSRKRAGSPAESEAPMRVQVLKVEELHEDPANVNLHSDRSIAAIKASLARFGQQKPLVVDRNRVVRAGNGALRAARELGWAEVAVVFTDLAGAEATGFAIADNRSHKFSHLDTDALPTILEALRADGIEPDDVGFAQGELAAMLALLGESAAPPGPLEFEAGSGEPGEEAGESAPGMPPPASQVRMVQLFLTVETFPEFAALVGKLNGAYGTANATDCVLECLRRASAAL